MADDSADKLFEDPSEIIKVKELNGGAPAKKKKVAD